VSEHELDALDRTLQEVERPEPPAGLTETVMKEVTEIEAGLSRWRRWRRAAHSRRITNFLSQQGVVWFRTKEGRQAAAQGGAIVRTKILWGVTGVAATALVSIFVFGYPPIGNSGTEGSIGAAQRYQGATFSMKDVKVPDSEVQQFIQSDTFDRLLKDSTARNALLAMFNNEALAEALANPMVAAMLANSETRNGFLQPTMKELFSNAALLEALAKPGVHDLFTPASRVLLTQQGLLEALGKPNVQMNLAAGKVNLALADPALKDLMTPALQQFLEANMVALSQPAVVNALGTPAVQHMLADHAAFEALMNPAFENVLADPAARLALSNPAAFDALNQPAVKAGLANLALMNALGTPAARMALGSAADRAAISAGLVQK
jgi:hypothetical protein